MSQLFVETFPVGVFQCNCSLLIDGAKKEALIIDPGDDVEKIIERIEHHDLSVWGIWHTHAHIDHIGGTKKILEYCSKRNLEKGLKAPKVFLHQEDLWLYENVNIQAQMLGLPEFEITMDLEFINSDSTLPHWDFLKHHHTPGHTPGSSCLHVKEACHLHMPHGYTQATYDQKPKVLFSGDTLFRRSVGRTDLWGGDSQLLTRSIKNKIYQLNDNVVVIPGHGPITSIEEEKIKNPFVKA